MTADAPDYDGNELVTAGDFAAVNLTDVLCEAPVADLWAVGKLLRSASEAAAERGDEKTGRALLLLAKLSFMRLQIDASEPYREAKVEDVRRWELPGDFAGTQNDVLSDVVETIPHPGLRARVADIVFYNDRRRGGAVVAAIAAYAQTIEDDLPRLDGLDPTSLDANAFEAIWLAIRGLQLARMSTKGKGIPDNLMRVVSVLYERAKRRSDVVAFHRIAEALGVCKVMAWEQIGQDCEVVAAAANAKYNGPIGMLFDFAGSAFERANDNNGKLRCYGKSLDVQLSFRDQSPMATTKAHLTQKALRYARSKGLRERVPDLRDQLRRFELESLDEVPSMPVSIDLGEMRALVDEAFAGLSLSQSLLRLATLASIVSFDEIREGAERSRGIGFFSNMFGTIHNDARGRQVAQTAPSDTENSESSGWFLERARQYLDLNYSQIVNGMIEPARQLLQEAYAVEARHFHPIALRSSFVPSGFEHIFALGFARLWQGDYITAAYLLIPQMENALRSSLDRRGVHLSRLHDDGNQEDRGINVFFGELRAETEKIFGADMVFNIDMLFSNKPGPALRHEMAHGKFSVSACYSDAAVYACWLIYKLTCTPLISTWDVAVAPNLEPAVRI